MMLVSYMTIRQTNVYVFSLKIDGADVQETGPSVLFMCILKPPNRLKFRPHAPSLSHLDL